MNSYIEVSRLGTAFLPGKFAEAYSDNPIRQFDAGDGNRNQLLKFLKRGGTAVLTGAWENIQALYQDVIKHEDELLPPNTRGRDRAPLIRQLLQRVLTTVDCVPIASHSEQPTCHPEQSEGSAFRQPPRTEKQILHYVQNDMSYIHHHMSCLQNDVLPGLLGEQSLPEGIPTLLPIHEAEQLLRIPLDECPVRAIDASVVTHPDVLAPRSQETIDLVYEAIKSCEPDMPESPKVLDVGCGSGVLSIASWQLLEHKSPSISATDILPEAAATARINWRRLSTLGKAGPESALITYNGSLFEPVAGQRFNLIIFNAPWVVAPAKNRAELALNDENQATIFGFIEGCRAHLTPNGRVLIGYADNAANAAARLEEQFQPNGLAIHQVFKDRISTHRAKRRWQNIYAYVLVES